MNKYIFMRGLVNNALKPIIRKFSHYIMNPPGRSPDRRSVELAAWFKGLDIEERQNVLDAATDLAKILVFTVFTSLDGSRKVVDEDIDSIEISFTINGQKILIHDSEGEEEYLHDLFKAYIESETP